MADETPVQVCEPCQVAAAKAAQDAANIAALQEQLEEASKALKQCRAQLTEAAAMNAELAQQTSNALAESEAARRDADTFRALVGKQAYVVKDAVLNLPKVTSVGYVEVHPGATLSFDPAQVTFATKVFPGAK